MRTIRIGVAGLGTVGRETVRLLLERRRAFARRLGAELRIDAVCDRRAVSEARRLKLPASVRRLRRVSELLRVRDLDVVVETLGGLGEARALVLGALRSGSHVVTANKRLLAEHWDEIASACRGSGGRVRFEASVAGGIPLLDALDRGLAANRIESIHGILNGTSNFVLSRMAHDGLDFSAALARARRLGLAERDPSMDIDGSDVSHKVSVLASLLTGRWLHPASIPRSGIVDVSPLDIAFAADRLGCAVRLLGSLHIAWNRRPARVAARVGPVLLPLRHPLAGVHDEYNAVLVRSSSAGDLMFYGKGAGAGPAGSAVVGDVLMLGHELLSGNRGWPGPAAEPSSGAPEPAPSETASFYLRLGVADRPGALARIAGVLARRGISIARIHQEAAPMQAAPPPPRLARRTRGGDGARVVPVFITTHPSSAGRMEAAVGEILRLREVARRHLCMRML